MQCYIVESVMSGVRIVDPDGRPGDVFGSSVAMNKDSIVIASKYGGNYSGSICIFNNNKALAHTNKFVPRGNAYDTFGASLSMNKDFVVVGSRRSGKVHIYRTQNSWKVDTIKASDRDETKFGIRFGAAVAINDRNEIVVGAPWFKARSGITTGAAFVFKQRGGRWRQIQRLSPTKSDGMGYYVTISNDSIILSANKASKGFEFMGALYIYKRTRNGMWKANTLLRSPNPTRFGLFGFSTSIYNNQLVVSAPNEDDRKGNVYVYVPNGKRWKKTTTLKIKDNSRKRVFGRAVSVHGDKIVVGTITNTSYLFELKNEKWVEKDQLIVPDGEQVSTVTVFDDKAIVGCKSFKNGKRAGVAFLFDNL